MVEKKPNDDGSSLDENPVLRGKERKRNSEKKQRERKNRGRKREKHSMNGIVIVMSVIFR